MNNKKSIWIFIGVVVFVAVLVSGFILTQPTAEGILTQTIETMKTIESAHAVVDIQVDTPEKDGSVSVEVWGRHSDEGPGSFRLQVLETSEDKAADAVVVSDGATLWAYSPSEGKVFVGTAEEAKNMLAEKRSEYGDFNEGDFEKPENAEEVVQMLLEYFTLEKIGTEDITNESADLLKLVPIPDQMPAEYAAVGGFLQLWIDRARNVPLAFEYTGGSLGEVSVRVSDLEINPELEDSLFTFEIPADAEVLKFADLAPKSISLAEAVASAEFDLLTPSETPQGATLVDVLEVRGTIVQRYTLPDGGSFTIAQGISDEASQPPAEAQAVEVRGVDGTLFVAEDGSQVLVRWTEGDIYYYVAGDISAEQALSIAESLQ